MTIKNKTSTGRIFNEVKALTANQGPDSLNVKLKVIP
jgi:hypothetical protein